jgi:hypothetical protein
MSNYSIIQELKREGYLKLWQSFRSRSFHDWSGNGRSGTITGVLGLDTEKLTFPGVVTNTLSYGIDTGFDILADTERTYHFWLRLEQNIPDQFYSHFSQTDGSLTDDTGYYFAFRNNQMYFGYNNGTGASATDISPANFLDDYTWTHISLVIDRPNEVVRYYKDGVDWGNDALDKPGSWARAYATHLGSLKENNFPWYGSFRDVLMVDKVMTQTEIYQLIGELMS